MTPLLFHSQITVKREISIKFEQLRVNKRNVIHLNPEQKLINLGDEYEEKSDT